MKFIFTWHGSSEGWRATSCRLTGHLQSKKLTTTRANVYTANTLITKRNKSNILYTIYEGQAANVKERTLKERVKEGVAIYEGKV